MATKQVNVRLDETEKSHLQDIADLVGLSQGRTVSFLVENYYRRNEQAIAAFKTVMAETRQAATARLEGEE